MDGDKDEFKIDDDAPRGGARLWSGVHTPIMPYGLTLTLE